MAMPAEGAGGAMRVVYFGNNWTGWQVLASLRQRGVEVAGLVLHPPDRRTFGDEILAAAGLPPERVFDGSRLDDPGVHQVIAGLGAEMGISVFFAYIIRPPLLEAFDRGIVNLHPGLLPHNRGVYANVWSIVEGTPAGATLHYVDQGVDTGDIVAQREVAVLPTDTGRSLYRRLEKACLELFDQTWPSLAEGTAPRQPQDPAAGSRHTYADVQAIDRIDLDGTYTGRQLIDILRARTFPPHKGAYFEAGGKRIHLRLELTEESAE